MATYSSILAWEEIPWTEEPGRLQSMGLQRVRLDFATKINKMILLKLFFSIGKVEVMEILIAISLNM